MIKALQNLYDNSTLRIKMGKYLTKKFAVIKSLRQEWCISSTLFKMYTSAALKMWKRKVHGMGMEFNDGCLYTLQFADDQVVITNNKEDMEYVMRKLLEKYRNWELYHSEY